MVGFHSGNIPQHGIGNTVCRAAGGHGKMPEGGLGNVIGQALGGNREPLNKMMSHKDHAPAKICSKATKANVQDKKHDLKRSLSLGMLCPLVGVVDWLRNK